MRMMVFDIFDYFWNYVGGMRAKFRLISFLLLFSMYLRAQAPKYFYAMYGGTGDDVGYGVQQLYNEDYVVVGSTTSFGNGQTDVYLLYIDKFGQEKWHKTFGGVLADVGKKIVFNPSDSGFVMAGYSNSLDSTGFDAYVIRVDKNGLVLWEKRYGGSDWEFANDLAIASDNTILVCGSGYSTGGLGKKDAIIWKIDLSTGNLVWMKFFGGTENDEFASIRTKDHQIFYACGTTCSFGEQNGDIFCQKLTINGDTLLKIVYGGPLAETGKDVIEIDNGDIILAGGSNSFSNGKSDAFYAKFSPNGSFKWKKNRGLSGEDEEIERIVRSQTANLEETVVIYPTKESVAYKNDIKTIFINYDGDYYGGFDSGKFGFSEDDQAFDIALCSDKGYVEIGFFTDTISFDRDVFLIKMDSTLLEKSYIPTAIANRQISNTEHLFYPNPCSISRDRRLEFQAPAISELYEVEMFDILGISVNSKIGIQEGQIDVSRLYPGIFTLRVRSSAGIRCQVIILHD